MSGDRPKVLAAGELLWDLFPDGARFGGAPVNFAHHAASLGADTSVVTAVGNDELGTEALQKLLESGLGIEHVGIFSDLPTGTVNISLDPQGVASYHFNDCDAWDRLTWSPDLAETAGRADVICFGTLGQRSPQSRETIQRLIDASPPSTLRVFDVNLRSPFYTQAIVEQSLDLANVLKLNEDELPMLVDWLGIASSSERDQVRELAAQFDLRVVALTRGERGSLLSTQDELSECDSAVTEVVDTVGAGDAFTAAFVMGLLHGADLESINQIASRVAAYVCSRSGATPALPPELRSLW